MSYNYQGQPGMPFPGQNPPHGSYPGQVQMPMPFSGQNPTQGSYPGQNQASMPMPEPYSSMPNRGMPPSYPNQQNSYPQPGLCNPGFPNPSLPSYPQQPYPQANQAYPPPMSYPNQQNPSQYPSMNSPYPTHPSNNFQNGGAPSAPYSGDHHQVKSMTCPPSQQYAQGHMHAPAKIKMSPTIFHQANFDASKDAEDLRKAMKGFGSDEKAIIKVLANRTNLQRLTIAIQFETLYGKNLIKNLKDELSGDFEKIIVAMMTPMMEFYAKEIHRAISGMGTDECVLIEILCTLSNNEIRSIQESYRKNFGKSLQDDLRSDTSGCFGRLMVSLSCANRDESGHIDKNSAVIDAKKLHEAGVKKFGTDESTFNAILVQRSYPQLKQIFQEYEKISGHSIQKAIKKEFSGNIEKALLTIAKCVDDRAKYFAKGLKKSMQGMGTDDRTLIRIVVTRSEIDMGDIKKAYKQKYGKSLEDAISSECSGFYKKCIIEMIS